MKGLLLVGAFASGIAAAATGWALWQQTPKDRSATELMEALMWGREPVGGPFALIDHDGRRRTDTDFRGKLLLIYFGFTLCSDVCPTELQAIASAIDQLGPAADAVQPLFITVDPEKDTPEQLKSYVALFHPRLIGLTGDPRAVKKVALAYKGLLCQKRSDAERRHRSRSYWVHFSRWPRRQVSRLRTAWDILCPVGTNCVACSCTPSD